MSEDTSDPVAAVVPEVRWMALDPLEFERLRRLVRENAGRSDQDLLVLSHRAAAADLGAVEAGFEVTGIRLLGLLLFGHEESLRRFVPHHEVTYEVDGEREVLHGPILRILDEFKERGVPDAALDALGEALARRDYARPGAVRVEREGEETRVVGVDGVLVGEVGSGGSVLNPLLAEALRRVGSWGAAART